MLWPNGSTVPPVISSAFGPRESPIPGASTFHRGADFVWFTTVCAIADGTVVQVGVVSGWWAGGVQVWVQHDGFFSRSLHLSSTSVRVGDRVHAGQSIGVMGSTGTATGDHLHLEVGLGQWTKNNTGQVDPVTFIMSHLGAAGGSAIEASREDDMAQVIRRKSDGLIALVDREAFSWMPDEATADINRKVFSITDEQHELNDDEFERIILSLGIPKEKVGKGYWSRTVEIDKKQDQILAALGAK